MMDGLVLVSYEIVTVGLMNFGVMDSSFGGCFELFNAKEWTSGGVVNMVNVTGGALFGAGVGDVS